MGRSPCIRFAGFRNFWISARNVFVHRLGFSDFRWWSALFRELAQSFFMLPANSSCITHWILLPDTDPMNPGARRRCSPKRIRHFDPGCY